MEAQAVVKFGITGAGRDQGFDGASAANTVLLADLNLVKISACRRQASQQVGVIEQS